MITGLVDKVIIRIYTKETNPSLLPLSTAAKGILNASLLPLLVLLMAYFPPRLHLASCRALFFLMIQIPCNYPPTPVVVNAWLCLCGGVLRLKGILRKVHLDLLGGGGLLGLGLGALLAGLACVVANLLARAVTNSDYSALPLLLLAISPLPPPTVLPLPRFTPSQAKKSII